MPINPNIALGIQQPQPVNMLGQMGQLMALKAAQQETEGYEGVKSAITGGMDASDPRMLQFGKRGIEAFRAAGEGRVKQQDALTKAYLNQRKSLDFVSSPDDLLAHGLSQFNDPVIAPQLKAQGLTPEKLTASFQKQLATEGFESLLKKRAMGLDDWYKDQTSRRNTDVSATAPMMNTRLAEKQFNLDQKTAAEISKVLRGEPSTTSPAPVTPSITGDGVPVGGGGVTTTSAAPKTNVLADQVAPQTMPDVNVNALASGGDAQQQIAAIDAKINALMGVGSKATPIVQALIAQKNSILTAEKNKYGEITTLEGINPETNKPETYRARFNNLTKQYEAIPKNEPAISVSLSGAGSSELNAAKPPQTPTPFQSALGTGQAKDVLETKKAAQDAASIIETNDIGRKILDSGAITGAGANFFVGLNQALKTAGVDFGYADAAANSQAYVALMAQNTAKLIKQFGAGTGLSDADREYAMKAAGGQVNLDEKAMRRVLDINDRAARNSINRHNESVKGIKSDIPLTVQVPKAGNARVYTSTEQQALEWANSNANDPRAAQIKQRLGVQ